MLGQINQIIPMLDSSLEQTEEEKIVYSERDKQEIVYLIEKLFRYGKHIEGNRNAYHLKDLLITKGESRNRTVSWMQVDVVDLAKLQRNIIEKKKLFYCDKRLGETIWFVSYFHCGDWIDELKELVQDFEKKCFKP